MKLHNEVMVEAQRENLAAIADLGRKLNTRRPGVPPAVSLHAGASPHASREGG